MQILSLQYALQPCSIDCRGVNTLKNLPKGDAQPEELSQDTVAN